MFVAAALGAALVLLGVTGVVAALVLPFVPGTYLDPTLRPGAPQLVVLAISFLAMVAGWLWLRQLRAVMRALRRAFRPDLSRPTAVEDPAFDPSFRVGIEGIDHVDVATSITRPDIKTWRRES